jgi:hypothetical protein
MVHQQERPSPIARLRRVAVIGAGISGLAAAKCLLDEKLVPVVFEPATEIGGVWNYHEELTAGGGVMYRSLRTNTSRQTFAFSDFPLSAALPDYPERGDVLAYLHDYAAHFGLAPFLRLNPKNNAKEIRPHFPLQASPGPWYQLRVGSAGKTTLFGEINWQYLWRKDYVATRSPPRIITLAPRSRLLMCPSPRNHQAHKIVRTAPSLNRVVTYPTRPKAIAVKPKSGARPAMSTASERARG